MYKDFTACRGPFRTKKIIIQYARSFCHVRNFKKVLTVIQPRKNCMLHSRLLLHAISVQSNSLSFQQVLGSTDSLRRNTEHYVHCVRDAHNYNVATIVWTITRRIGQRRRHVQWLEFSFARKNLLQYWNCVILVGVRPGQFTHFWIEVHRVQTRNKFLFKILLDWLACGD